MKFLIHANAPWVRTGYGVQAAMLGEYLQAAGHEVAFSSTYGQQGGVGSWRGMRVYPCGYETNSNDAIHNHAMHWFDGDPANGWIITLIDVWVLVNPLLKDFNVLAWTPVDHFPAPQEVLRFFHRTDAVPLAMSEFGQRELTNAGLHAEFIPLGVDTTVYAPTFQVPGPDGELISCRRAFDLPEEAFVVGMVAMNKGWDRKGFNEAFRAFGQFWKKHPEARLFIHSTKGMTSGGADLTELAIHAAVPEHTIVWVDQYAYQLGLPPEMMAAAYTAMDVLLAPSHGEGFCVPLIEAQACGTPVIATDFSAQSELIGCGFPVMGQPEWDPAQHASYIVPFIGDILGRLEECYEAPRGKVAQAVEFAARYDFGHLFQTKWLPLIDKLAAGDDGLPLDRERLLISDDVAVLVPVLARPQNVAPLVASHQENSGNATLYLICDDEDADDYTAALEACGPVRNVVLLPATRGSSFAQKVNAGLEQTSAPWLFICGDDVRFHEGWIAAAEPLTDRFDVIGTNDTAGEVKNPDVAAGRHADHFFVRRAYVDEYGACLDGPGVLAPEVYGHWYTDKEIVQLAKARGVFSPCLDSVVEHLHPGYDGNEAARESDPAYMKATETAEPDRVTFLSRLPLIEMQRTGLARVR